MPRTRPHLLVVLCALALVACPQPEPDPEPEPTPAPDEPTPLTFVTYNAGLAIGFVGGAEDRAPSTTAAIAALDADVVCLQEMWDPAHVAMLETAAADTFEHRFFPAAQQETGDEPACTEGMLSPLTDCLDTNCGDVCGDDLVDCVLGNCFGAFFGLSRDCNRCVQANVGEDPDDVFEWCTTGMIEYAYDGSFGTGLLSKHPLLSVEEHVFFSTTNRRSVLHAVVDAPDGEVDVYCTHLTAVFSTIPYPREGDGSWETEQRAQVEELIDQVAATATTGRTAVLGDFNTGPEGEDVAEEVPDHYDLLAAAWPAPYVELDGRCTFCPENTLSSAYPDGDGELIDHVFVEGLGEATSSTRILDGPLTVERCGEDIEGAYSDHYGVQVTMVEPAD